MGGKRRTREGEGEHAWPKERGLHLHAGLLCRENGGQEIESRPGRRRGRKDRKANVTFPRSREVAVFPTNHQSGCTGFIPLIPCHFRPHCTTLPVRKACLSMLQWSTLAHCAGILFLTLPRLCHVSLGSVAFSVLLVTATMLPELSYRYQMVAKTRWCIYITRP